MRILDVWFGRREQAYHAADLNPLKKNQSRVKWKEMRIEMMHMSSTLYHAILLANEHTAEIKSKGAHTIFEPMRHVSAVWQCLLLG